MEKQRLYMVVEALKCSN